MTAVELAAIVRANPSITGLPPLRVPPLRAPRRPVRVTPGPVLGDPLTGVAPTWREDHAESPFYDRLVAELGIPGTLVGPIPDGDLPTAYPPARRGRRAAPPG